MRFPPPAGGKIPSESHPRTRISGRPHRGALPFNIYSRGCRHIIDIVSECQKDIDTVLRKCYTYYADTTSEHIGS